MTLSAKSCESQTTGSRVAKDRRTSRTAPAAYLLRAETAPCFKVFFFHVEKTGGTTVRKLAREGAAAQGMEVYTQGMLKRVPDLDTPCNGTKGWYSSRCCSLERMLRDLEASPEGGHPRLFVEVRASRLEGSDMLERLVALRERNGDACPTVLWTLLREPHRLYTSFYRYFARLDQKRKPEFHGRTFEEWVPPNMQTEILGGNDIGFKALFDKGGNPQSRFIKTKGTGTYEPRSRERVEHILDSMDVVGTTGTFKEAMLFVADMSGMTRILYTPTNLGNRTQARDELNAINYDHLTPDPLDFSVVPPTAERAAELIEAATPVDRAVFAERFAAIQARAASTPGFAERLARYERALDEWYNA